MEVIFSDRARYDLQNIYDYYFKVAPYAVDKIIEDLLDRVAQLETHPFSGPIDPLYRHFGFEYRFLVKGNYKIIYTVQEDMVYIIQFFDSRQSPDKSIKSEE